MDLQAAAEYTSLPVKALRAAIMRGELPFSRPRTKRMILDRRDIDAWLLGEKQRFD